MKNLSLEDIKEILRIEVRKSILHSSHISEGHNEIYDSMRKVESREKIYSREINIRKSLLTNSNEVKESVDKKLQTILESLEITLDKQSLNYKKLRSSFIDLYLLRFKWIKDMMDESGRTDEDFRREVDEKLDMNLFPELVGQTQSQVQQVTVNQEVHTDQKVSSLSKHQSTSISVGIDKFISEKYKLTSKSEMMMRTHIEMLIEEFGDISLGKLDRGMCVKFKDDIRKLPRNRSKIQQYRNLDFHEQVSLNVDEKDRISTTTVNNILGYVSSFMKWSRINGFVEVNFFEGMKLKKQIRQRDERDRFTEKEIKKIFQKHNYIEFTEVENHKYSNYWTPLISVFSGMRLNEICSLYLDNIIQEKVNGRKKIWCFNILEEPDRPDKHLKTLSSKRVVPIHDTLIDLGFIEFVELLKKRHTNRQRLFQELKYGEGSYIRNVSYFFNKKYLPLLGLKTDKKNFHSIRHTVVDHLKQRLVDISFINELVGHHHGNIDLDRYGKGFTTDIIYNKCVKKINYETSHTRGIDFKSLKMDWKKIITTRVW
ncbi:MAG: site-specific integrase [Candidatus Marinimicrobia bacterium]|nr:site-specific integrase [Candidatus Neomarinimicrobiota bacterium]